MENQNTEQGIDNVKLDESQNEKSQEIDLSQTAIVDVLDIVKMEYEMERNKKHSFENRAGLLMSMLAAISIFLFEKLQIKEILMLVNVPLTFLKFVQIISGLMVYLSFIFSIIMIVKTIMVKEHKNFDLNIITNTFLGTNRVPALCEVISMYKDIIKHHRNLNNERAYNFSKFLYGLLFTIIFIITYVNVK